MHQESTMPGELHWEVGYFGKPQFRPAMRSHGKDVNLPDQLRDKKGTPILETAHSFLNNIQGLLSSLECLRSSETMRRIVNLVKIPDSFLCRHFLIKQY
jgi:hypothetical protein